jgi:diguanylate cyclase (GGDEF)-like protein
MVGDTVLRAVAEVFLSSIRAEDVACRYGGEEFTIMLPDIAPDVALERADAIRRAVASLQVPLDGQVCSNFSVSIGVAFYPLDGESADLLLRRADMALYRAKRSGRNRVTQYEQAAAVS